MHSIEEVYKLFAVNLDFPDFGLVKIVPHYPVPSFDSLLAHGVSAYCDYPGFSETCHFLGTV